MQDEASESLDQKLYFSRSFYFSLPQNEPEVNIIVFLRAKGKARFPKQLLTSLTTGYLTDVTNK